MNCASHRADTKFRSAEIQVVRAIAPVRFTDTENILAVSHFHIAHRPIAALAGFQARKVVATLRRLLDYFRWNLEHLVTSPPHFLFDSELSSGNVY